jgi:hypothetical protein
MLLKLVFDYFHALLLVELGGLVSLEHQGVHVAVGLASAVVPTLAAGCKLVTALLLVPWIRAKVVM